MTNNAPKGRAIRELKKEQQLGEVQLDHAKLKRDLQEVEEGQENIQTLLAMMEPIAVSLPPDTGGLWEYAIHQINASAASKAKAGLALLMLKERVGHGNFVKELEAREIAYRTAADAMGVAKLLLRLPPSKVRALTHLSSSKLIELARLPEETIQEIAETEYFDGKPLDELDRMSVRELKDKVRRMNETHGQELEAARRVAQEKERKITQLEEQLHKRGMMKLDLRIAELEKRLSDEIIIVKGALLGPRAAIKEILEWEGAPRDLRHACAQAVARIRIALDELQADFMLDPVDLDVDDSWMQETE